MDSSSLSFGSLVYALSCQSDLFSINKLAVTNGKQPADFYSSRPYL